MRAVTNQPRLNEEFRSSRPAGPPPPTTTWTKGALETPTCRCCDTSLSRLFLLLCVQTISLCLLVPTQLQYEEKT